MNLEETIDTLKEEGFQEFFRNDSGSGFCNPKIKTLYLVAHSDYLPILNFKRLFHILSDEIVNGDNKYRKFIFDKRALKTFHQPSMKWYFLDWKTEMIKYGLNLHIKILPDVEYFRKAVESARRPLLKQMPEEVLSQMRIEYADNIKEAINIE